MRDPTVLQAKRYGVFTCQCDTPLCTVVGMMAEEDISALVIVDQQGYLEGIITRMDILRAKDRSNDWARETAGNWMSPKVVTVSANDRLSKVARLLLEHQIHRVVAVQEADGKKRPVAVISAADLVYHLAKEPNPDPIEAGKL